MRLDRSLRVLAVFSASLLVLGLLPASASATPPSNDDIGHAQVISGIPSRITTDTREATRNQETDGDCVGENSVWYQFDPTTDIRARAVLIGSGFDTRLAVFTGTPSSLTPVACNDDTFGVDSAVEVAFRAGTRYYVAVSSYELSGGQATLRLYAPVKLAAKVTITSANAGDSSGAVRLRGKYRCTNPAFISVSITVRQRVGNDVARGWGSFSRVCTSKSRTWTMLVDSETDLAFRSRRAVVNLEYQATDGFTTIEGSAATIKRLGLSPHSAPNEPQ